MAFCSDCGTKLRDGARFCEGCGSAVHAPAERIPVAASVAAAESVAAPMSLPPANPVVLPPAEPTVEPTVSFHDGPAEPVPAAPRKGRRGLVAGIGGLAAVGVLGVVGYVVYDQLTGPAGGADSPEAAVIELSRAADAEDAVTALSLLPPGEVGPLVNLYQEVEAKATSTGVATADDPFAGFDLHLEGVRVQPEQLGEDVAAVTITSGTVSWTLDPDQLQGPLRVEPDGDVRRASEGSADLVEVTRNATEGAPLRIMTVQRDGKWYVSPMYTLLEQWRASEGLPAPDFTQELDLEGTGAASATAAVEEATGAVATYDVDALLDLLSPDEAAALYHYRDAIVMALHRDGALAELQEEGYLTVDDVDAVEGEEIDGRVPVTIRGATGTLVADEGDDVYSWTLQGNCISWVRNGDSDGGCLDEAFTEMGLGADLAAEFQSLTILTHEVDGRWYLSPLATLVADARNVVADLDADDVTGVLGVPQFGSVDAELTEGATAEAELTDPFGSALFQMEVPAGKVFSVCSDNSDGWVIFGPDGRPTGTQAVHSVDGGTYRVLAYGGGQTTSISLTPGLSEVQSVPVPGTVPALGDGACGARLVTFQATAGEPLTIATEGGSPVEINTPSGETVWTSVLIPEETGQYSFVAWVGAEFGIEPLGDDVLRAGSRVLAGVAAGTSTYVTVFVEAEQEVDITVYGDGTSEPALELYTMDGEYVDAASSSWFSSSATVFPYYEDVAQIYTLEVYNSGYEYGEVQIIVTGY